jgi:hypothetical protein
MNGEPQPDSLERLERGVFGLKKVWYGGLAAVVALTSMFVAVVMSGGGPRMHLDDKAYLWPLMVVIGLAGAYVLPLRVGIKDPAGAVRGASKGSYPGWEATGTDDPYHWFPLYSHRLAMRVGFLGGGAFGCAVGFFLTGDWPILIGTAILLALLVVEVPTRPKAEAFAAVGQQRPRVWSQ